MQHVLQSPLSKTSSLHHPITFLKKKNLHLEVKPPPKQPRKKNHLNWCSITIILCYFDLSNLGLSSSLFPYTITQLAWEQQGITGFNHFSNENNRSEDSCWPQWELDQTKVLHCRNTTSTGRQRCQSVCSISRQAFTQDFYYHEKFWQRFGLILL